MTARIVVSCDGYWDDGRMPCRGALPTHTAITSLAIAEALTAGWDYPEAGRHLCPAHARREAQ